MTFVQDTLVSLAGQVRIGIESSNASLTGDDQFHANSGNTLQMPALDSFGPSSRWFEVFSAGVETCNWTANAGADWVKLSKTSGTVGPDGEDSRVLISIDWKKAPSAPNSTMVPINITTPCRKFEKYAYKEPQIMLPVNIREVPSNFTEGFVEADGTVSIEGPHFQSVAKPKRRGNSSSEAEYHIFKNYGRTLGGVGLAPPNLEKLKVEEAPALQYDMYLFSNYTLANVTVYLSPSHNYLSDYNPLEYAIAMYPAGDDTPSNPKKVRYVGDSVGSALPDQWGHAVADAVWGVHTNTSTTSFNVSAEGAYTLKIWCLLPSVIVQKVVVDLGGVRESYLGPPESFLMGRDEMGQYNMSSFLDTPDVVGATTLGKRRKHKSHSSSGSDGDEDGAPNVAVGRWGLALVLAVIVSLII